MEGSTPTAEPPREGKSTPPRVKPFAVRPLGSRKRRRLGPAPPRSSRPAVSNDGRAAWLEELLLSEIPQEEVLEAQRLDKICDRLRQKFRNDGESISSDGKNIAFRIRLLPAYFTIVELEYALPYSLDNQRFLRQLEQGRIPWEQLRDLHGLQQLCEGKYTDGALSIEVEDCRLSPGEAAVLPAGGKGGMVRQLTLRPDDDSLLQDLAEAEANAVMEGGEMWDTSFKLHLEAKVLRATAIAPCLHPSLAVGRVCNLLQYNRLKLNAPQLKSLQQHFRPLERKVPQFGPASYAHSNGCTSHPKSQPGEQVGPAKKKGSSGRKKGKGAAAAAAAEAPSGLRSAASEAAQLKSEFGGSIAALQRGGAADAADPAAVLLARVKSEAKVEGDGVGGKDPRSRGSVTDRGGGLGTIGSGGGGAAAMQRPPLSGTPTEPGSLFGRLTELCRMQRELERRNLLQLPKAYETLNKRTAMLRNTTPAPPAPEVPSLAEAIRLMPEDLLPAARTTSHSATDPNNVPQRAWFQVRHGAAPQGARPPSRPAEAELQYFHEMQLLAADPTYRHELRLSVANSRESLSRPDALAASFRIQGSANSQAFMRQWKALHVREEKARACNRSAASASAAAAAPIGGSAVSAAAAACSHMAARHASEGAPQLMRFASAGRSLAVGAPSPADLARGAALSGRGGIPGGSLALLLPQHNSPRGQDDTLQRFQDAFRTSPVDLPGGAPALRRAPSNVGRGSAMAAPARGKGGMIPTPLMQGGRGTGQHIAGRLPQQQTQPQMTQLPPPHHR